MNMEKEELTGASQPCPLNERGFILIGSQPQMEN
jgi:hypothetical protein